MQEREIENRLVQRIKAMGGRCWKWVSPGTDGVPDRICLLPEGQVIFVELKAPGKHLRPLQILRKQQLEKLGFSVYCLDSAEQVDVFCDGWKAGDETALHSL